MTSRSRFPRAVLLLALLAAVLAWPSLGSSAQAEPAGPAGFATPGQPEDPQEAAEDALAKVEELLAADPGPTDPGATEPSASRADADPYGRGLTLALRDLAVLRDELPESERATADRLLARPGDGTATCKNEPACYGAQPEAALLCNETICVHRVASGAHAANVSYAQEVLATVTTISSTYLAAGYKAPLPDGPWGGRGATGIGGQVDIYLADVGAVGFYGYCTTDGDPGTGHVGAPAYCVLDNDYRAGQYGTAQTPLDNLRVTAAHEYFHAVQFAYDVNEDAWLMEATATWVEDEVFNQINDNRFYLRSGPLANPQVPLDSFVGNYAYGAWAFIRYLSERYPTEEGALPVAVREIWELALGERYSLKALDAYLAERGTSMTTQFARFSARNRQPGRYYAEGDRWPTAPLAGRHVLAPRAPKERVEFRLDHLAAKHHRFVPSRDMKRGWRLRLRLNLNAADQGGAAWVTVKREGRRPVRQPVTLNRYGNLRTTVPFGRAKVKWIEVAAVNASTRYRCGVYGDGAWAYTCGGRALDDRERQVVVGRAYRP